MIYSKSVWQNRLPILFFGLLLTTGIFTFDKYGISWDEPTQRDDNGYVNYNFVFKGDKALLTSSEKYHGAVFEVFLVGMEKMFRVTDIRNVYLLRHLITFLFFFGGVLFFYLVLMKIFGTRIVAVTGCLLLVLSPRIFADGFYNSKDIPTLVMFIISFYTLLLFINSTRMKTAAIHGFATGLLIGMRVIGIVIPAITLLVLLIHLRKSRSGKIIAPALGYILLSFGFTVLFWPILWDGPFTHLLGAFAEMSRYPFPGKVLYFGNLLPATQLPWHYLPVWLLISIPEVTLISFFAGTVFLIRSLWKKKADSIEKPVFLAFLIFLLPVVAVIILHSVLYDGWRHLYFIFPFMVILSIYGLRLGWIMVQNEWWTAFLGVFLVMLNLPILFIAVAFPNEQVYFNPVSKAVIVNIGQKFDLDYWGLSYRKGLEYILKADSSDTVRYRSTNVPGHFNAYILDSTERKRLKISELAQSTYFLTNFREHPAGYPYPEVYSVYAGSLKILAVYKLK